MSYVVIDLEMCKVSKNQRKKTGLRNEIIEIGAVLLNDNLEIVDEFKTYVLPEYGRIDEYIENLTKIKNEDLCSAPVLSDALEMFFEWMPSSAVMVAWSDNDAYQLEMEAICKNILSQELALLLENPLDCQIMFGEKMQSSKNYRLSEALMIANIEYDEGAHDALVDAHNTALLFNKVMSDIDFTLTPYYTISESRKSTYCPFADLLADFSAAV